MNSNVGDMRITAAPELKNDFHNSAVSITHVIVESDSYLQYTTTEPDTNLE